MNAYLVSLGMGLVVGALYGLFNVRSPAPPVVALVGLLGILIGEQVPPLIRHLAANRPAYHAWLTQIRPHMFGRLPSAAPPSEKST